MSGYSRQTCAMYSSKSSALAGPGAGVARHADRINFRRRMHDAHTLSAMILRQVARVAAGPPVLMKHTTAAAARPWRAEMRTKKDERRTWCCTGRAWCCRTGRAWCDVLKGFSSMALSHGDPARAPLLAGGAGGRGLARLTKLWQGPRAKLPLREPRVNQQNSIKTIGQMSDR